MTHDEILTMAKEAGGYESPHYPENLVMDKHDLIRFAALVAAKERESCAQACQEISTDYWMGDAQFETAMRCCNTIRARLGK